LGALVVVVSVVGLLLYLLARPTHRPIKMKEEEEEHKAQAMGRMM
jgi:flagellar biosynthesis/type III secretory pathway M-ring protein FliF/YscJ